MRMRPETTAVCLRTVLGSIYPWLQTFVPGYIHKVNMLRTHSDHTIRQSSILIINKNCMAIRLLPRTTSAQLGLILSKVRLALWNPPPQSRPSGSNRDPSAQSCRSNCVMNYLMRTRTKSSRLAHFSTTRHTTTIHKTQDGQRRGGSWNGYWHYDMRIRHLKM